MYGRLSNLLQAFFILITAVLGLSSFNTGNPGMPLGGIFGIYHKADALFHLTRSTTASDSTALAGFVRVIEELGKLPDFIDKDTLLFQCYLKKGILLDAKYDFAGAKDSYCKALSNHRQTDSLAFVVYVYAGTSYYNLNIFDSANYFLLKAEILADRFRDPEDNIRMNNTLGVLYYDNGNYQQGKNYFNQALEIVKGRRPFDTVSAVSLETNIATCFYRLGLFRESLSIYHEILAYRLFTGPIYINMGMAYASLDKYKEALDYFRKVDAAKMPGVLNEMGHAELQLNRLDSAEWFLDQLRERSKRGQIPNGLDLGLNDAYRADLLAAKQQYIAALTSLQKAITLFSPDFHTEDIFSNPVNFTGTFVCYRLFDALFKKAVIFERLFRSQPKDEYLRACYDAYKAALSLLEYIEKSYDTDDSKIFLKKRTKDVTQGALSVCLELYRLHPAAAYLEQAFMISDKNKASIMTANLEERSLNNPPGTEGGLLKEERNIKYNIARLNARSEGTKEEKDIESMAREKTGYEIELSRIQKQLEQNGGYYKQKYDDSSPGIKDLQERLGRNQALINFYITSDALHLFILTRSSFAYTRIDSLPMLQRDVEDWSALLKTTENGKRFKGEAIGNRLYKMLIKPIQALIPEKDEWIIIPDGFLYFLPFESLPAGTEDKTLLETTTISYQFSSRFMVSATAPGSGMRDHYDGAAVKVLAFAPFAGKGNGFDQEGQVWFSRLSASREEIAGLAGNQYFDSLATKDRFLKEINQYPIVHLATHAVSSIDDASKSFIAFYPKKGSTIEDCLFLEELYGLDMSSTKLVVISACETGQGELVSNEGVISLARAFAYAGCASTISSLWKADDQATSFILRRFYVHLKEGVSKARALQQAKLDYLKSGAINKSPAYWSHLILIGNTEPIYKEGTGRLWSITGVIIMIFLCILFWIVIKRKRKEGIRTKK